MKNILHDFNHLLQNRLFLIYFVIMYVSKYTAKMLVNIFDLNTSLGWRVDVMETPIESVFTITNWIYLLVYGYILLFTFIKTNLFYSKIHVLLIGFTTFIRAFWKIDYLFIYTCEVFILVTFLLNMYYTISANEKTSEHP